MGGYVSVMLRVAAGLCLVVIPAAMAGPPQEPSEISVVRSNDIIVKFHTGVSGAERVKIAQAYGCQMAGLCPLGDLELVNIPEQVDLHDMVMAFEQRA